MFAGMYKSTHFHAIPSSISGAQVRNIQPVQGAGRVTASSALPVPLTRHQHSRHMQYSHTHTHTHTHTPPLSHTSASPAATAATDVTHDCAAHPAACRSCLLLSFVTPHAQIHQLTRCRSSRDHPAGMFPQLAQPQPQRRPQPPTASLRSRPPPATPPDQATTLRRYYSARAAARSSSTACRSGRSMGMDSSSPLLSVADL